ncbi:MAG: hypothetical protein HY824_11185 [Acidobacteria bacterium]|nr:hypothetical protein [Acidobacteriota bacterium]
MSRGLAAVVAGAIVAASACGGGSSGGGNTTTPTPTGPSTPSGGTTITITASGVSPAALTVEVGSRVTFVNSDTRNHDMASDPHPEHSNCPAINDVGFLTPGQSKTTGNLTTARTCGFHDHDQPSTRSLQGTITVR